MAPEASDASVGVGRPLRAWLRLYDRKKELEAEIERINPLLQVGEEACLNLMAAEGLDSVRIDGRTVFTRRDLWAGPTDAGRDALVAALQGYAPTADFVRPAYNAQTLSAWVRERDRAGERLPPELEPYLKVTEKFSVRVHG